MIRNLVHVNVNVTDAERSVAFYEKLGFRVMHVFGERRGSGDWEPMRFGGQSMRGAVMSLGDEAHQATKIELIESVEPRAESQPRRPRHQAGVSRIAIRTRDLQGVVERLRGEGVAFEGETLDIEIVGARRFVLLRDPDDTLLELIEFSRS